MRAAVLLVALVFVPQIASAQPPVPERPGMPPSRDVNRPPATGTSRIRGRIVAADTGQPLRRVLVRIFAPELRENRSTSTDGQGRYEFADLPAGRYTISASKGGFVNLAYGQRRPLEAGKPLQLGENQTADRIDLALPRGSVITGRVVDEYGEPVANAMVQAMQFRYVSGQKRPMTLSSPGTTPDNGEFRLWGLSPGEYVLSATLRDGSAGFSGAVDDGRIGFAPTYYPGTASIGEAQLVRLGVGETLTDLTIPLVLTRTARITGSAVGGDGRPLASGFVTLIPKDVQGGMMFNTAGAQLRPDGTFTISNVGPGTYIVRANAPRTGGGFDDPVVSQVDITVNGDDIDGLRLAPLAMVTLRGRVVIDAASAGRLHANQFRVMIRPRRQEDMMAMAMSPPAPVREDATFEMKALPAGPSPSWLMKSVRVGGVDVTDTGVEFRSGDNIDDVEVELTAQVPSLSGTVTTSTGSAASDYTVIAFPQDPTTWSTQIPGRIGVTRPDQQARFELRSLRPGEYYVVAVESVEQGQWTDPGYLETLRGRATALTLGEAETKALTLKLIEER
jgi:hypothetical protein